MARKKRKYKKNNTGLSFLLFFILIILMSYASYLLYSFAKSNGLINLKAINEKEKDKITENKEENKTKLNLLSKLFANNSQINNNSSIENNSNTKEGNTIISANSISSNNNESKNTESDNINNNTEKINENKQVGNNINSFSNNKETVESPKDPKNKINSKNFFLFLACLDKDYELYLAQKTEKIDYTDSPIFSVISFLVNYKPKEPYLNLIPSGTKLLGAWIKQGILYLDFNKNFLNNKNGLKSIEIQIYQIVNTAMQFSEVNGVRFLIDGKSQKYYSDEGFLFDITFKKKQFPSSN